MKKIIFYFLCFGLLTGFFFAKKSFSEDKAKVTVKIAVIIPKGSEISETFDKLRKEVREKTKNEVDFKVYWGGVQGDEDEVLRKIRVKQLHGGIFSGVGLGKIVPAVRVTEIPYVFTNYDEVSYVRKKLEKTMDQYFEDQGFKVLGWNDAGFVYGFSTVPIKKLADLKSLKCWVWGNDPLSYAFYDALGVSPVSLSLTDVITSVSSRLIDSAAIVPLGAVAFRWQTKFKYISDFPILNSLGALIITKDIWNQISPESQNKIMEISANHLDEIAKWTRQENDKALELLKKSGMTIISSDPSDMPTLQKVAKTGRESLIGKLYSKELLDKTLSLLEEYRKNNPKGK